MDIVDDLTKVSLRQETILTIGAFDGVHLGHQALIGAVVDRARSTDRLAALVTFHPHPAVVLAPDRAPRYLTTPGEKMALLEGLGIDLVVLLAFNRQVTATPARAFMQSVATYLRLRELWVGPDFALGRNREGDVPRLEEVGREFGYEVHVVEPVVLGAEKVSSSRIRALLGEGRVAEARRLLGRYPSVSGEVVVGARRGHSLGFPTANLEVRPERAVPADGVYAVFAVLGARRYPAVANVGVRPTFDNGQRTVEVYIFDFDQDIYGCDLVVEFVARLRDELRFERIDDLVEQMKRDSKLALEILDRQALDPEARLEQQTTKGKIGRGGPCLYRVREIEHTADRAMQVWGSHIEDLFVGAGRGMYSLMADLDGLVAVDWREVRLEALDRETLLVDWLNELLFLTETEGLLFVEWQIESLVDRGRRDYEAQQGVKAAEAAGVEGRGGAMLVARAGGLHAPVTRAQIKATTFHDLKLVQDETGWSTVITFDV
jgi:riboflavin kinase/FMN adenylyltransferase